MWMRMNALAAAALLSFLSAGAAHAQQLPSMNTQAMMSHQRMMNQMEMMQRSQTLQQMARAREAQSRSRRTPAKGTASKKRQAASHKPK
jgi:hypothetical protein